MYRDHVKIEKIAIWDNFGRAECPRLPGQLRNHTLRDQVKIEKLVIRLTLGWVPQFCWGGGPEGRVPPIIRCFPECLL